MAVLRIVGGIGWYVFSEKEQPQAVRKATEQIYEMNTIIIIVIAVLFSALFSGLEIAFMSSNKLRIELDKKQGGFSPKIISFFADNPSQYISTMLVGNNIALSVYSIYAAKLIEPFLLNITDSAFAILITQTLYATMVILLLGEFLPKMMFRNTSNDALKFFAFPLLIIYYVLYPVVILFVGLSGLIIRVLTGVKIHKADEERVFGKIDINQTLSEIGEDPYSNTETQNRDLKIFQNALDFSDIKLRDCMVPRTEICAFQIDGNPDELKNIFIESGYSKILIYKESIDEITGYVHVLDLFRNAQKVRNMLNPVLIVPETMPAYRLLENFISNNKSIAVVVDEFGGTSGIVTIEDIMEEIFGEIEDEYDVSELIEKQVSENEYIFSARLETEDLNNKYGLNLTESSEYKTLAGYIMYFHGSFPQIHNEITIIDNRQKLIVKILKVSASKIDLVSLRIL